MDDSIHMHSNILRISTINGVCFLCYRLHLHGAHIGFIIRKTQKKTFILFKKLYLFSCFFLFSFCADLIIFGFKFVQESLGNVNKRRHPIRMVEVVKLKLTWNLHHQVELDKLLKLSVEVVWHFKHSDK